jgi:transposase
LDDDNTATLLFGLEGVKVASAEWDESGNLMLTLVTACADVRCYPGCGVRSARSLGLVTTRPRDLPLARRPTSLRWTKRRWACGNTDCPRRSSTESLPTIPSRSRLTSRLRASAGAAVADGGRTVTQSARDHEISWPVTQAAFAAAAEAASPKQVPAVEHLGIDETRRGKAKFRLVPDPDGGEVWEVMAGRWHIGFCDLTGGNGLLGQIEGRTAASVSAWIEAQSDTWRTGVRVVAIDMCTVFKAAVRDSLPHVTLVADRFHVAQLANTALTEVRRRVTVQVRGRRGRKGNREWELRNRLTRSAAKMHADHLNPMVEDLQSLPKKIGQPILAAWNVKEDLMDMLALHGTPAPTGRPSPTC